MFSFRSINSTNNQTQNQEQPQPQQQQNITFPLFYRKPMLQTRNNIVPQAPITVKPDVPKLKWGEPTWNLFHVIAEKIIPENFFNIRTELFDIVRNICYNLPCPDCANHARNYINAINFNAITNPLQLKDMLFVFHNEVNKRKDFPLYNRDDLDNRYSAMNLRYCVLLFLKHFRDKHKSTRMLADDLYRAKLANKIEKWFVENLNKFAI
jgi:hypothetical protein